LCAKGDQFGFSSGGPGESGPRSSTSATGSSKASTFTVSAATAICGLTCLTFDRVAFFAPARLGLGPAGEMSDVRAVTAGIALGRKEALAEKRRRKE
jgi:hypothetical protein